MDVMTQQQRYKAMLHNRGRTGPELKLALALWHRGFRYLTHKGYKALKNNTLIGKPDLIFSKRKVAVFVDGCFWHGCSKCHKDPQQSGSWWVRKIEQNRKRDRRVTATLEQQGWIVLRIPEHSICTKTKLDRTICWLIAQITNEPTQIFDNTPRVA